jgi:hypothetical protein
MPCERQRIEIMQQHIRGLHGAYESASRALEQIDNRLRQIEAFADETRKRIDADIKWHSLATDVLEKHSGQIKELEADQPSV